MSLSTDLDHKYWGLHTALAWVLSRNPDYTARCKPDAFWPYRPPGVAFEHLFALHKAWALLFEALNSGRIPARGIKMGSKNQKIIRIKPSEFDGLDWAISQNIVGLRRRAETQEEDEELAADANMIFLNVQASRSATLTTFSGDQEAVGLNSQLIDSAEKPTGPDYIALSSAAYWIASEGGTKSFVLRDEYTWAAAYQKLISNIAGGNIQAIGRPKGCPLSQRIEGYKFQSLPVAYYFGTSSPGLAYGKVAYLNCAHPIENKNWQEPNDCILMPPTGELLLTHLEVYRPDVIRLWPKQTSIEKLEPTQRIRRSEVSKEERYQSWIDSNKGNACPTRKADLVHMRELFPNITREEVRALRNRLAPSEWKKKGRRAAPK